MQLQDYGGELIEQGLYNLCQGSVGRAGIEINETNYQLRNRRVHCTDARDSDKAEVLQTQVEQTIIKLVLQSWCWGCQQNYIQQQTSYGCHNEDDNDDSRYE